jgi:hypothetical protein
VKANRLCVFMSANRLTTLVEGEETTHYLYNGQGDRIAQIEDGAQTPYILDLNAGLTQVLNDGTRSYVYGLDLISQQTGINEEYPLRDALGSIRQMTDQSSAITGYKSYEPYGEVLTSSGEEHTPYGYTGEWTDASGMQYLRTRYYAPYHNRWKMVSSPKNLRMERKDVIDFFIIEGYYTNIDQLSQRAGQSKTGVWRAN